MNTGRSKQPGQGGSGGRPGLFASPVLGRRCRWHQHSDGISAARGSGRQVAEGSARHRHVAAKWMLLRSSLCADEGKSRLGLSYQTFPVLLMNLFLTRLANMFYSCVLGLSSFSDVPAGWLRKALGCFSPLSAAKCVDCFI